MKPTPLPACFRLLSRPLGAWSGVFCAILLTLASLPQAAAYPPSIGNWIWQFYEDGRFYPAQLSACTDPDGRLRMLFTDTSGFRYYNQGGVNHRVCKTVMKSFRPFSSGAVIDEAEAADLGDFNSVIGTDRDAGWAAAQEARRTSVYGVLGGENTLSYGGSFRRLMPGESFGVSYLKGMSYHGPIKPMAYRPVLGSSTAGYQFGFSGSDPDVLAVTTAAGPVQNSISLTSLPEYGVIRLSYFQNESTPRLRLSGDFSDAAPAGWGLDRTITGGSLTVTADRRDFHALITSHKILPNGNFSTEVRLFRLRTATTTTPYPGSPNDFRIDIASITTNVVYEIDYAVTVGRPAEAVNYPQVLRAADGEPRYVMWGGGPAGMVMLARRVPPASGTAEEIRQSIAGGYVPAGGSEFYRGERGLGSGPSAALDRLDRVHLAYRRTTDNKLIYQRQGAAGDFTVNPMGGRCTGAPAITIGPGEYPYLVYQGYGPSSAAGDKLVTAYPSGLADSYHGDYEDRDGDRRIGLLERAQGSSDTVADHGRNLDMNAGLTTLSGSRFFQSTFALNLATVRDAGTTWTLADGNDTIEIKPAWSLNGNSFSTSSFSFVGEFIFGGSARYVTVRDTAAVSPGLPRQLYRLQVRRLVGAP